MFGFFRVACLLFIIPIVIPARSKRKCRVAGDISNVLVLRLGLQLVLLVSDVSDRPGDRDDGDHHDHHEHEQSFEQEVEHGISSGVWVLLYPSLFLRPYY